MAKDAWTAGELFDGLEPTPEFVEELERLGLLVVVGRDGQGGALYAPDAREELEKVLDLVELGYQLEDIAAIAKRVGLPVNKRRGRRKAPVHLRASEVIERAGVPAASFEQWIEAGLVRPSLRPDGGDPLYAASVVTRVERLSDLSLLGLSLDELGRWNEALDWLDVRRPSISVTEEQIREVAPLIEALKQRLKSLGETTRRWSRLVAMFNKRAVKLRRASGAARVRGRRRLRTRTGR